ncbi:UNVERIFIED_CONTAM: hypothetical protein FKN15_036690 [Acipenser sinensis]
MCRAHQPRRRLSAEALRSRGTEVMDHRGHNAQSSKPQGRRSAEVCSSRGTKDAEAPRHKAIYVGKRLTSEARQQGFCARRVLRHRCSEDPRVQRASRPRHWGAEAPSIEGKAPSESPPIPKPLSSLHPGAKQQTLKCYRPLEDKGQSCRCLIELSRCLASGGHCSAIVNPADEIRLKAL